MDSSSARGSSFSRRIGALLEILGVFVGGNAAASYLAGAIGLRPLGPLLEVALAAPEPDLRPLTWAMVQALLIQYGCLLVLAFAIHWNRRRTFADYGLTMAGHAPGFLVGVGLLGFCCVALPFKVLWITQQYVPMGAGSFWWALFAKSWTPSFWLFFVVGSFGLVPIVEELFFRGYCQSRLQQAYGGGDAVLIAALFFVFTHGQYHQASVLSVATMLCLIPMALGIGYLYLRTRSLLPCMVLHGALNFPTKGIYDWVLPIVMLVALILFRRRWLPAVSDFAGKMRTIDPVPTCIAVVCAVAVAVGLQRLPELFLPLGIAALAAGLLMEWRDRRAGKAR